MISKGVTVVTLMVAFLLFCCVVYKVIKKMAAANGPRYPQYMETKFRKRLGGSGKYTCSVCRRAGFIGTPDMMQFTVCPNCEKRIKDRAVLEKFNVPASVNKGGVSIDTIISLNLLLIDASCGFITEQEAKNRGQNMVRGLVKNTSKYRRVKERMRTSPYRAKSWMLVETHGETETCLVCGLSRYGSCKCQDKFLADYDQGRIPSKLREVSQRAQSLNKPEIGFWFEDWLYLHLIANDLGSGAIAKSEANSEKNRYIDVVYDDVEQKLAQCEASRPETTEAERREAAITSQDFMDDILS